jgi:cytochrome c-type biogenesis protein CcmE
MNYDPKARKVELDIADLQSKTRFVYTGQGLPSFTPEGRAIYIRQDGGTGTTLYVYEGSSWVAK